MSRRFFISEQERLQIGERIKEIILDNYETESEFLSKYDIPAGTFGWHKQGKIPLGLLILIANDCHICLNYILTGKKPKYHPRRINQ
jgi:hypothetical protein